MSTEVQNAPVVAEPAPAAEAAPVTDSKAVDVTKKADKKSLIAKLKAIIKKVLGKKEPKAAVTTEEPAPDADAQAEPAPDAAPTTTAAA